MFYFIKTPGWLKKVYRSRIWEIKTEEKKIYLSFDDGPHPEVTPFVLHELKRYNAKATFFCVGKNVVAYPELYKRIIEEGHTVGNHTFHHLNGWKTKDDIYLDNIAMAKMYIDSNLFRPPYGKITSFQQLQLGADKFKMKTIMWSVLSGDFDVSLSAEQCLQNVLLNTRQGDIVVFHDSEKASKSILYALPKVLSYFTAQGYIFEKIVCNDARELV
ncbi:MAG: polysaccharide deacetylase family protein [Ferruginibacter sp.]